MSYVSSGAFRADIERVIGGALTPRPDAEPQELELHAFPPDLRAELEALADLFGKWTTPKLCVLRGGDFCPVPALTGEGRSELLDYWFPGDETATDFVMAAVDIVNGGGGFYVLVHPNGRMGLLCEDPYSYDPLACSLSAFLRALVAAHHAACTRGLPEAKEALRRAVDARTADLLLTFARRLTPEARAEDAATA